MKLTVEEVMQRPWMVEPTEECGLAITTEFGVRILAAMLAIVAIIGLSSMLDVSGMMLLMVCLAVIPGSFALLVVPFARRYVRFYHN